MHEIVIKLYFHILPYENIFSFVNFSLILFSLEIKDSYSCKILKNNFYLLIDVTTKFLTRKSYIQNLENHVFNELFMLCQPAVQTHEILFLRIVLHTIEYNYILYKI